MVGIADEVAVGEEQQLDDIPAQIRRRGRRAGRVSAALESGLAGDLEKFMSAILTYLGFNVTKQSTATKY